MKPRFFCFGYLLVLLASWKTPPVSSFAPTTRAFSSRSYLSLVNAEEIKTLCRAADPEHLDEDEDEEQTHHTSKLKWKKKRFLMMKDVAASIRSRDPRAVEKAELAVQRIQYWHDKNQSENDDDNDDDVNDNDDDYFLPTLLQAYNMWIHAVARLQHDGVAAEAILRDMSSGTGVVEPNAVSYSSVMDAYAKQADREAPAHAERILFELIEKAEQPGGSDLEVTSVTCDTVLNAWAQQGTWQGAKRAQEILDRLENSGGVDLQPSLHSYSTVISAWANSLGGTDAAKNAQALLDRTLAKPKLSKANIVVRPDTVVFNSVIHAWATSGDPTAGSKAVKLLEQMHELSKKYDCRPDTVTYNTVLSAISHSGHIHAAAKAQQILKEMVTAHRESPETAPAANTISYNCVLHALSKTQAPGASERAQTLLNHMVRSKQDRIAPDVYSFTSVLDSLAKSKEPDKATKARKLLDALLETYKYPNKPKIKLSSVPFNTVLNAAAFSAMGTSEEERKRAIQVAVQTFSLMRSTKDVEPDMISYGNMLKAIANLMPPSSPTRTEMAIQVFGQCCQDGLVGDLVWNEARRAIPARELANRTGLKGSFRSMKVHELPRPWTRNLRRAERKTSAKKFKPKRNEAKSKKAVNPVRRMRYLSEQSYQSGRDL